MAIDSLENLMNGVPKKPKDGKTDGAEIPVHVPKSDGTSQPKSTGSATSDAMFVATPKKSDAKSKTKRRSVPDYSTGTGVFRNIPSNVIKAVRAEFCDATNNTDALMAYLACHGSGSVAERANACLTETQQQLVKNWDGDSYSAIVKQIETLTKQLAKLSKTTDVIELLATYMVYDRVGFRNDNPRTPKDINLREDGVVDVVLAAEEQAKGFQYEKNTIQGRPIRK